MPQTLAVRLTPFALTCLRLIVGFEFLVKGLPKIQTSGTAERLASGIHFPLFMGWFPTVLEPIGGALLILGLGTRWLSLYFVAEMVVTGVISKIIVRGVPFAMPANTPGSGFELDALIFGASFILVVLGGGIISADALIAAFRRGGSAGRAATVVSADAAG